MDPKNAPNAPGPVAASAPHIMQIVGILATLLGYGYQAAAAQHPDVISSMGAWADWSAIAGMLITAGGMVLHQSNAVKAAGAVKSAAAAPPMDPAGERSAEYTAATAFRQAILDENYEFAQKIATALKKEPK